MIDGIGEGSNKNTQCSFLNAEILHKRTCILNDKFVQTLELQDDAECV